MLRRNEVCLFGFFFFGSRKIQSSMGNVQLAMHVRCICGDTKYAGRYLSLEFRRAVRTGDIFLCVTSVGK